MTSRALRWVTGGVAALSIALLLGGLPLAYLGRHVAAAGLWNFPDVFEVLTFVAVPVVGFVLASRRPANKISWILLATGLLLGLGFFGQAYGWYGLIAARPGLGLGRHPSPTSPDPFGRLTSADIAYRSAPISTSPGRSAAVRPGTG